MIGNSASASGRGLRRTEAEIVSSIGASSALQVRIVRPQLDRGREDAAHVTRLRGWILEPRLQGAELRCSGPTSSVRSSLNFVAGGSLEGGGSSDRAAALLDTHLVPGRQGVNLVTIQAHRHLGEERGQRLAIRLVAAELLRIMREADQDVFDPAADVVPEFLLRSCCRRSRRPRATKSSSCEILWSSC